MKFLALSSQSTDTSFERLGNPQLMLPRYGDRVFVTILVRPMEEPLRRNVAKLSGARIFNDTGNLLEKAGMFAFGAGPNPDAKDGICVGVLLDLTRKQ